MARPNPSLFSCRPVCLSEYMSRCSNRSSVHWTKAWGWIMLETMAWGLLWPWRLPHSHPERDSMLESGMNLPFWSVCISPKCASQVLSLHSSSVKKEEAPLFPLYPCEEAGPAAHYLSSPLTLGAAPESPWSLVMGFGEMQWQGLASAQLPLLLLRAALKAIKHSLWAGRQCPTLGKGQESTGYLARCP